MGSVIGRNLMLRFVGVAILRESLPYPTTCAAPHADHGALCDMGDRPPRSVHKTVTARGTRRRIERRVYVAS